MSVEVEVVESFFQFEADFVESLRCIPMQVRMKLDTCGVKLKLAHWHQFTQEERQRFVALPCENPSEADVYRTQLQQLVTHYTGKPAGELSVDPHPPWHNSDQIPEMVQAQVEQVGASLVLAQWRSLTPPQRFALIKLSRPSHENNNFEPALQEFGI